ncbi:MAG: hypothetical protein P8P32_13055 [Akkermansiaceae bacterium]|nr:hypothetical protein [Akkermansiaceae bacterium]MDG2323869.1 hypothetical protein [Akkermansiaceae bacterium]
MKFVQVGRFHDRVPETGQVTVALIVGKDNDDVGLGCEQSAAGD